MKIKLLVIGLLTIGVISLSSISVSAEEGESFTKLQNSKSNVSSLTGDAQEKTLWVEDDNISAKNVGTIGESGGFVIDQYGDMQYNTITRDGLYVKAKDIKLDYSSGEYLTPDNKLYITIPVSNDNKECGYAKVRIKYVNSQYDIFDVTGETMTSYIPPSVGSNDHTINYLFEVTLKDGVDGYIDWADFYATGGGHAPVTEDMEFEISGWVDNVEYDSSFSYSFYLGNPQTDPIGGDSDAGAIQMDYSQDSIDLVVDKDSQTVCYNDGATASFKITNEGNQFVFVNESAFLLNEYSLISGVPYDSMDASFMLNGVDLVPYWEGQEEMYPSDDLETWQKFTINPGESADLTISIAGDLDNYEGMTFQASAILPFTDLSSNRTKFVKTQMNYSYDRENLNCVA